MSDDACVLTAEDFQRDQDQRPWHYHYNGQRTLIIDDFTPNMVRVGLLLHILSPFPFHLNTHKRALWDTVVITSNLPPRKLYPRESSWNKDAIERRITNCVKFGDVFCKKMQNTEWWDKYESQ